MQDYSRLFKICQNASKLFKLLKIIEDHLGSLFLMPGQKMKGCDHLGAEAKIILPIIKFENQKLDANLNLKEGIE